jgi:predicted DNA-binding ribbon-helix-helix protein
MGTASGGRGAAEEYCVKSGMTRHSIIINGHKTSVSLEDIFWDILNEIAASRGAAVWDVIAEIDAARGHSNLSSAIRVFVFDHVRRGLV